MTLHPAVHPDEGADVVWLDHVRRLLKAAAFLAATGTPTEVLIRPRGPMARELRAVAQQTGVEAYANRSGRYLIVRFVPPGSSTEPSGPAVL